MRMLMVGLMLCAPAALAADDDDDRDDGPGAADALDVGKEVVDHHLDSKSHSERRLLQPEERRLVVKSGMSWEEMKAVREASAKTGVQVTYESGSGVPVRLGAQTSEYGGEAALRHGTIVVGEDAVRLSSWGDDALRAGPAGAGYEMRGGAMAFEGAAARGGYAVESAAFRGGAAIGLADDVARFGARGLLGGGAAAGLGAAALGAGRRRRE
jgi:hypothetical protein